ncbi:hypothetical protein [Microbacterium candidum]|uniref:Alpha/beta hydrolase n=1 Tax=Microbacterium candidum TaxID=3041922 RepID=A0ABT7MTS2_9MICO|nr:hypothetical protein [Microbacterium sp. ASV49]MDL9977847.1 hypothetical protein [Microbacterium sp. ASV49]
MSDDIDIRSGGAVAVDTERLRAGAEGYSGVADRLAELHRTAWHQAVRLSARLAFDGTASRAWTITFRLQRAQDDASLLAQRLAHLAAVYEIVELDIARQAAHGAEAERIQARLRELISADPSAATDAQAAEEEWKNAGIRTVAGQYTAYGLPLGLGLTDLGLGVLAAGAFVDGTGGGRIPRDAVLTGPVQLVRLTRVDAVPPSVTAPASAVEAAARIPQGDVRVRVERYAMPDGSRRFAVYIAGTNPKGGRREAWDWESNVELYGGRRSASFDATEAALRAAGAAPGDAIYEFGHSQGGMIAGRVAVESGYDTRALVTFGSPTEAEVDAGTLSVQLRHTDDPVAALASGGAAGRVGAADSVVVSRVADPAIGLQDFALKAHRLDTYAETAAMFDRSDDPRAGALHTRLEELRAATSVEAFDFAVERTERK